MTTTTTNAAKKLYKVFAANHDDDVIQDCKTKLNICIEENRISVCMNVERKTLKSAYNYFHKALEQAVADGALDAKIAQFGEFADDINDINFDGKDSITAFDNVDNSFAYGIDDNTCVDLGYYFWFWVKTDEATAEDNVEAIAETDGSEKFFDAFCKLNATENSVKAEEKNFTANCYYTYTKDGDKRNGLESKKFATATEAAIWILNYVRENGYTLVDGTNIRDCTVRKEYFMSESDFSAAEVEPGKKSTAKVDRLDELKAEKSSLISAISHSLENHFIKLDNGEFVNASDAGFTTFGIDSARPEFDKLYFKDDSGEYVEVPKKAIDALHRLEVWLSYNADAIEAEIAKTKFKFEVGKWYASDETDWNGNPCGTYRVLKRTKKFVTIYDPDIDDWHYIDNYDPDDEIDGEFDCIFRKKIQYDERGEYVNWRDDDDDLVTLCAKDETDKPVDDDDPKDDLRDSLKRAAEIARQKYHEYEREGNEFGMLNELELYNICTDAIKELEVA